MLNVSRVAQAPRLSLSAPSPKASSNSRFDACSRAGGMLRSVPAAPKQQSEGWSGLQPVPKVAQASCLSSFKVGRLLATQVGACTRDLSELNAAFGRLIRRGEFHEPPF